MTDLDFIGADTIDSLGIEGTDIAKMFGGLLQGTGGMLNVGTPKGKENDKQQAERLRLESERKRAEQSASRMKVALGVVGGGAVAAGLLALILRRRNV